MTKIIARLALLAGMAFALPAPASAQAWPNKPVRIVTAFAAGSASDIVARLIAEDLQTCFGQAFIVDNKPGASGIVGTDFVAKSPADGYTLLLATNTTNSSNPSLFKKLPYDAISDFTPIARVCYFPFALLVNAGLPINTVDDLKAYAKSHPAATNYGYGNSTGQVSGGALSSLAHLNATAVPYKSSPQVLVGLMGGEITYAFGDLASSAGALKSQKVRAIAVSSEQRSALMPELPPVATAAALPGFDLAAWVGILGPCGLPPAVVDKLGAQITRFLSRKDIADKLTAMGAEPAPGSATDLGTLMQKQLEVWGSKVKAAGIQPE
jgi:tripartite-type tricarboxylate transporter receptor subunit TctC